MIYKVFGLLIIFLFVSTDSFNDETSIIRQRVLEQMIWPTEDLLPSIAKNGRYFANTLNSSCYWQDIRYDDQNRAVWLTATHLTRITTMLQAYSVNGSQEQNDTKILLAAQCALDVWLNRDWQNPNWWWNRISVPISVTSHLLMLGENVTEFQLNKIKEISYRANWWAGDQWTTGANLVWMIQAQLYRSLATQNFTGIEQGFDRMWQDIVIQPIGIEGIQSDYAYHFHETQLLSAAYGVAWAENIFSFFSCSQGTNYEPSNDQLIVFAKFLTEGDAWMIIGNQWDFHAIGRAISRPDDGYIVSFNTQIMRSIAELITLDDLRINLTNLADRLDKRTNASLLIGNRHFYTSDYQVHRRANWTAAIKIKSIRTIPDECGNGENLKGEHTGSGTLHLFTTDTQDYYQIFPLLDWQAINGITVEHDIPIVPCPVGLYRLDRLPFAGGVSDGMYGLAVMDTVSHNLTAQRSWHFYDNAIFALATNLTLTTSNIAWTTLASRLLSQGQITVGFFNSTIIQLNDGIYSFPYNQNKSSNVQWIHVGQSDIAYVLQGQGPYSSLGIDLRMKTGNYDTIGASNLNITARTLTIWIDHGRGPYTLDYQYIILPNITLESVPKTIQQYEEEQIFECISSNKLFHGIVWPSLKRASFVLWDNVTTTFSCQSPSFQLNIQLNDAGFYLFSETDSDFTLTASHPMRLNNTLNLSIDRTGYGQECTTTPANNHTNVTLILPTSFQFMGQSVYTSCKKQTFNY